MKILFLLVPYGYIIIKIKRIPKEMTESGNYRTALDHA